MYEGIGLMGAVMWGGRDCGHHDNSRKLAHTRLIAARHEGSIL